MSNLEIKETQPKKFCFVLMPFSEKMDDVYHLGIKEACQEAGAYCERVDEQQFEERILDRIYNQISKADIVVADMTGRNANVFYEVGYAHALGKTTILLTSAVDDIPFDLKHFPHIIYNSKIKLLREELTKKLLWAMQNSKNSDRKFQFDFDVFLGEKNLTKDKVVWNLKEDAYPVAALTIYNNSYQTYNPGDYSLSVITNNTSYVTRTASNLPTSREIPLPDGRLLHLFEKFQEALFPQSYTSLTLEVGSIKKEDGVGKERHDQTVLFRISTSTGFRDFPLQINYI